MALVVLSEKVLPEVLENWRKAKENSEAQTGNQFVELVLEHFLNPKTREIKVPTPTEDQQREIQLKDNEIGRLQTDISLKEDLFIQLSQRIVELEKELAEKPQPIAPNIPAPDKNQVIINLPPVVAIVLDKERETAEKSGQKFTRAEILLNTFWDGIVKGQSYPFRVWSSGDLQRIKKQLETATNGN